jgi:hypothetical protein
MSALELNKRVKFLLEKGCDRNHFLYQRLNDRYFWKLAKQLNL